MFFSEQIKKNFTIFFGSFLGIIGIFFMGYSLYMVFSASPKKEILAMLPAENFKILLISTTNIPMPVKSTVASALRMETLPDHSFIVGYVNPADKDIVYFTLTSDASPVPDQKKCLTKDHYHWCVLSETDSLSFLYSLIDAVENGKPTLQKLTAFSQGEILPSGSALSFIGVTSFLPEMIDMVSIPLSAAQKEHAKLFFSTVAPSVPLFSGSLTANQYQLVWYKKTDTPLYPSSSALSVFSPTIFSASVDRYLLIKSPTDVWNGLFENGNAAHFPQVASFAGVARQKLSETFHQKVSWQTEVLPLLTQDVLFFSSAQTSSAVFSFSKPDLAKAWYDRFGVLLKQFAAEKVPTKKEHILADGTKISEVFPEKQAIEEKRQSLISGEALSFSAPNEVNPKTFPVVAYKGDQLFISEDPLSLPSFINPGMSVSPFVFPENKNLFLAAGIKTRAEEKLPVLFAEIMGLEKGNEIRFTAKIDWNSLFFISSPLNGSLETPFPTVLPSSFSQ